MFWYVKQEDIWNSNHDLLAHKAVSEHLSLERGHRALKPAPWTLGLLNASQPSECLGPAWQYAYR